MPDKLTDWALVAQPANDAYSEPKQVLRGRRESDGHFVRTSPIVKVNGNTVTTHSGTQYLLLDPHPNYVEWCKANDVHVPTPEEPIKLI